MPLIPLEFLASLAAGLATGLGAVPVLFTKRASERLLDAMLGFAAGVIPESHRKGHEREATFGGIIGFGLMMVLDTIFA